MSFSIGSGVAVAVAVVVIVVVVMIMFVIIIGKKRCFGCTWRIGKMISIGIYDCICEGWR